MPPPFLSQTWVIHLVWWWWEQRNKGANKRGRHAPFTPPPGTRGERTRADEHIQHQEPGNRGGDKVPINKTQIGIPEPVRSKLKEAFARSYASNTQMSAFNTQSCVSIHKGVSSVHKGVHSIHKAVHPIPKAVHSINKAEHTIQQGVTPVHKGVYLIHKAVHPMPKGVHSIHKAVHTLHKGVSQATMPSHNPVDKHC